jgi:hypothetical protein
MKVGNLVEFVHAPPRFKGEQPREPSGLLGTHGVIVDISVEEDVHDWGGVHEIILLDNRIIRYHGDFMKVIQ